MVEIVRAPKSGPIYDALVKMRVGDYIELFASDLQPLGDAGWKALLLSAEESGATFEKEYTRDGLRVWRIA